MIFPRSPSTGWKENNHYFSPFRVLEIYFAHFFPSSAFFFFLLLFPVTFFISSPRSRNGNIRPSYFQRHIFKTVCFMESGEHRPMLGESSHFTRSFLRCWSSFANLRDTIDWTTPLPIDIPRSYVKMYRRQDLTFFHAVHASLRYSRGYVEEDEIYRR